MKNYIVAINVAFIFLFFPGCVAGGSGIFLEAKKELKLINLRLTYSAYGGANLNKLKVCEVYYGSKSRGRLSRNFAVEVFRKTDKVQWELKIPFNPRSGQNFIQSNFHTKDLIGRDTILTWNIKSDDLTRNYEHYSP